MEKIEERKIVPIAAMISAGKSKLLNVILNINFLESKSGIGTKFVNILRYNPNITQPCFYHLKLRKEKEKYVFYKDNEYEMIQGENKIIEENISINKELSEKEIIDYDNIFYITEINSTGFIQDPNYLLSHDLCDIPGLSEYQKQENNEEPKEKEIKEQEEEAKLEELLKKGKEFGMIYKPKNKEKEYSLKNKNREEDDIYYDMDIEGESTYITEIYKRIKDYIDGAIIVLSIENYAFSQNKEIIAKLHKVIQKQIKNFLIVLNKVDLSTNPKLDIESCKGFLFNAFPKCKTFNLNINTFIPLSAIQVQNELLMEKSFTHLMYYYFYEYKRKITNEKVVSNDISYKNNFVEYLREILKKINISTQDIDNAMDELNNKEDVGKIYEQIKLVINHLNKISKGELELGIEEKDIVIGDENDDEDNDFLNELKTNKNNTSTKNLDNIEPISIIKMIYHLHKKKELVPQKSKETNQFLDYFRIKEEKKDDSIKIDVEKTLSNVELNNQIIDSLKIFYDEFKASDSNIEQIKSLSNEVEKLIDYLKIYDVIFIPVFGASNSGKSTIINGIIGYDLLPCDLRECTKRGILIRYSDQTPVIKKADFLEEEFSNKKYYYFQADNIIGEGYYQIQQTLRGLNYKFNDKEEDSFYYIKTRIKLFDDLGLDKSLKEMIYLIDFPGYGTGNFFENGICNKVISICNSFIFVSRNSVIKSKETKVALDSFFEAKENVKKFSSQLIRASLFVFNIDIEQTSNEEDIEKAKGDIQELIKGVDKKDINLSFYNAKFYLNYCYVYNYFYNFETSIRKEYNDFVYMNTGYLFSADMQAVNNKFPQHLLDKLIEKIGKFSVNIKKAQKFDSQIDLCVNNFLKEIGEDNNPSKNNIIKVASFCKENITKYDLFAESKIENFKDVLKAQINYVNEKKQNELRESINKIVSTLDLFFTRNFDEKKGLKEIEEFKGKMNDFKKQMESLITNNVAKNKEIIEKWKGGILASLHDRKQNLSQSLDKKNHATLLTEINKEVEKSTKDLTQFYLSFLEENDNKCKNIFKNILEVINNFQEKKIEFLNKYSYKEYLSNVFGNGTKDLDSEIINEIKEKCESLNNIFDKKGFKEWLISFFSSKYYLQNIIDMLVDTISAKIQNFIDMIDEESNKYLTSIIEIINNYVNSATLTFNDNQKIKWKKICERYKEVKIKIQELEKNNLNNP